tara:strand:+ start:38 stop:298 length:261 start_codon:yes stop_codon:yes gene_type:complete
MKHIRVRKMIPLLLESGPMNTHEIYQELKDRLPYASPTMHSLSNILAKNPGIEVLIKSSESGIAPKVGNFSGGSHSLTVWKLKNTE